MNSEERIQMLRDALGMQEGGSHYKDMKIQPVEFIHANNIGFIEGCVIKYVCRYKMKNGIEDLKKAQHFLNLLIGFETEMLNKNRGSRPILTDPRSPV